MFIELLPWQPLNIVPAAHNHICLSRYVCLVASNIYRVFHKKCPGRFWSIFGLSLDAIAFILHSDKARDVTIPHLEI